MLGTSIEKLITITARKVHGPHLSWGNKDQNTQHTVTSYFFLALVNQNPTSIRGEGTPFIKAGEAAAAAAVGCFCQLHSG